MPQALDKLKETPSQTAGPYVHIGLMPNFVGLTGVYAADLGGAMVSKGAKGERITLTGRVFDGTGEPIRDCILEIWQADAAGLYQSPSETRGSADPHFTGWGRASADPQTGEYRFETIKPGVVLFSDGRAQAPHISVWIVARGINLGLHTRVYFSDEAKANAADPVLNRIEHKSRVKSLIAERNGDTVTFDIHLQGPNETVFFDI